MIVCIVVVCVFVVVEPCNSCLCFFGCCENVVPYVVVCMRSESCKCLVYLCVLLFVHVLLNLEIGVCVFLGSCSPLVDCSLVVCVAPSKYLTYCSWVKVVCVCVVVE